MTAVKNCAFLAFACIECPGMDPWAMVPYIDLCNENKVLAHLILKKGDLGHPIRELVI